MSLSKEEPKEQEVTPLLCKDCKYSVNVLGYFCSNPALTKLNLVTGYKNWEDAKEQRYGGQCGLQGKYFEPKGII